MRRILNLLLKTHYRQVIFSRMMASKLPCSKGWRNALQSGLISPGPFKLQGWDSKPSPNWICVVQNKSGAEPIVHSILSYKGLLSQSRKCWAGWSTKWLKNSADMETASKISTGSTMLIKHASPRLTMSWNVPSESESDEKWRRSRHHRYSTSAMAARNRSQMDAVPCLTLKLTIFSNVSADSEASRSGNIATKVAIWQRYR